MSGALDMKPTPSSGARQLSCDMVMNHATVREQMDMEAFVTACAERGVTKLSLWADEIEKIGEREAADLLRAHECTVSGFHRAGPLVAGDPKAGRARLEGAKMVVDSACRFGADHCLVFTGGVPAGSRDLAGARAQAEDAIGELLLYARQQGMTLALEPLHPMLAGDRSCIVTLTHANSICDRLGAGIGVVVDVYHVWWDDRLEAELARAGAAERILGFHVNDWLVPTRHTLRDRGMMGDGIIDLNAMWALVRKNGYVGPVEVEIFSDDWSAKSGESVLDACVEGCEHYFGLPPEKS